MKKINNFQSAAALALSATFIFALHSKVAANDEPLPEDFYEGRTLTVFIASNPGGGTDTTARIVANNWHRTIPGEPNIRIRNRPVNVIQGNYMQRQVNPDGMTVGVFAGGGSLGPVARNDPAAQYDPRTWGMVGMVERGPTVLIIREEALERLTDPDAEPVVIGSVSTDRPQDAMAVFGGELLDWNVRFVLGYPSSSQMYLAYERGEIDMFGSGTANIIDRFTQDEGAVALVAYQPRADLPDVPTFSELLGDAHPGSDSSMWRAYLNWTGPSTLDKYFVVPPETPDNILQHLRTSFKALEDDAQFQNQISAQLGGAAVVISGEEAYEMLLGALDVDPEVQGTVNRLREKYRLPLMQD